MHRTGWCRRQEYPIHWNRTLIAVIYKCIYIYVCIYIYIYMYKYNRTPRCEGALLQGFSVCGVAELKWVFSAQQWLGCKVKQPSLPIRQQASGGSQLASQLSSQLASPLAREPASQSDSQPASQPVSWEGGVVFLIFLIFLILLINLPCFLEPKHCTRQYYLKKLSSILTSQGMENLCFT